MKENLIIKTKAEIKLFCIFIAIILIWILGENAGVEATTEKVLFSNQGIENPVVYLSDIPYRRGEVGWSEILLDKTLNNTDLTVKLNGTNTAFKKGIWAHATSTIEYDISAYKDYEYFSTYYGINATANNAGNGAKFYIYTSKDGENWTLRTEEDPIAMKVTNNAQYARIDIREDNFIRLYVYDNGSNASDNSVWVDAKLVKEEYKENLMVTVEEFDETIKSRYTSGAIPENLQHTLLQREFIKRVGQYTLRSLIENNPENFETLDWLVHDEEALRLWIIGGTPYSSYENSLQVLSRLYHAHKEDLQAEGVTSNGVEYKNLYLRMMLSLSHSHASAIRLWMGGNQYSDAVTRYEIYKQMHLDNKLGSNRMFENLTVEEMKILMANNIDDEEILWLRDTSAKRGDNKFVVPVKYTTGYNYSRPQYYSQENYAKWDNKYQLSKYGITYQAGKPKIWIAYEEGAVCGGISKTSVNTYGVWGYPSRLVTQPAHAAYVYLYDAGNGNNAWKLAYNVSNIAWAGTNTSAFPNGWGSRYATNGAVIKNASYMLLSQEAQNEYEKYEKSELILLLEDVYKGDNVKLEQIYRDALKEEIINLDAWIGLVNIYITDDRKTEDDSIELAREISEVMTYHPLPMYDLTRRLASKVTSPEKRAILVMLQDQTLHQAAKATKNNTLYYAEVPVIANALLGNIDTTIANFSFDGENAGKIVLAKQFQSAQVNWDYSLDGGNTWTACHEKEKQLTKQELNNITAENDIKIHISGTTLTEKNIYTIDITTRTFPGGVTVNADENDINGYTNEMEWTFGPINQTTPDPDAEWYSFESHKPTLGLEDTRLFIRILAKGTQTASNPVYFTLKKSNLSDTEWYIKAKHLSIEGVNGTQAGNPNNILDGSINTAWRSKHRRVTCICNNKTRRA